MLQIQLVHCKHHTLELQASHLGRGGLCLLHFEADFFSTGTLAFDELLCLSDAKLTLVLLGACLEIARIGCCRKVPLSRRREMSRIKEGAVPCCSVAQFAVVLRWRRQSSGIPEKIAGRGRPVFKVRIEPQGISAGRYSPRGH